MSGAFLLGCHLGGIAQCSPNLLIREVVVGCYVSETRTAGKLAQDDFDGNASSGNNGTTVNYLRIYCYAGKYFFAIWLNPC